MKKYILLLYATGIILLLSSGTKRFPEATNVYCRVDFSIENGGVTVHGFFDSADVQITPDQKNCAVTRITGVVYAKRIETGIPIRDQHLLRSDYFDVKQFPEITINSKSVECLAKNQFIGVFDLTIKGITKTIKIPFYLSQTTEGLKYIAKFRINRLDFSLGEESLILGNIVHIAVQIYQPLDID